MSKTDKDKPYWVRLNQEGTFTEHDHRNLGKTYTVRRYIKDEKGNRIIEDVPRYRTADEILDRVLGLGLYLYSDDIIRQAKLLRSAGRGHENVLVQTYKIAKYELVEMQYPDHCTEGEPIDRDTMYRYGRRPLPCTPSIGHEGYWWRYGDSGARQSFLREAHGKDRTNTRNTLRNMTKAANFRDEGWEDEWEEVEELTRPYRNGMAWALW